MRSKYLLFRVRRPPNLDSLIHCHCTHITASARVTSQKSHSTQSLDYDITRQCDGWWPCDKGRKTNQNKNHLFSASPYWIPPFPYPKFIPAAAAEARPDTAHVPSTNNLFAFNPTNDLTISSDVFAHCRPFAVQPLSVWQQKTPEKMPKSQNLFNKIPLTDQLTQQLRSAVTRKVN